MIDRVVSTRTVVGGSALVGLGMFLGTAIGSTQTETRSHVPVRPAPVTVEISVDRPEFEPLPAIEVPELTVWDAPTPGRAHPYLSVSTRPRLALNVDGVPAWQEPLPSIVAPELRQPAGCDRAQPARG